MVSLTSELRFVLFTWTFGTSVLMLYVIEVANMQTSLPTIEYTAVVVAGIVGTVASASGLWKNRAAV